MDTVTLNGKRIKYRYSKNEGLPIVFLHGYLESMDVFMQFIDNYLLKIPTLTLDIPGHGCSEPIEKHQTMEQIANQVVLLLDYLKIETFIIYGHSMGGYVAQAVVKQIPQRVKLLGLLHSNVFTDSAEKRADRLREAEAIEQGKLPTIAQLFLPKVIADFNFQRLENTVLEWIERVKTMQPQGIVSCLHAMAQRPDNTEMLNGTTPIHLIGSDSDRFLTQQMIDKMTKGRALHEVTIIEKCGHASFIEQPYQLANVIKKVYKEFY
ncbi:MAG TPA: alpha/beta hydrolase [Salinivirgaceae bacterium]|nr:alpha/beta hydrolase [Salinivirgaceae bacterium]